MRVTVKVAERRNTPFNSRYSISLLTTGDRPIGTWTLNEAKSKLYEYTDMRPSQVSQLLMQAFMSKADVAVTNCGR